MISCPSLAVSAVAFSFDVAFHIKDRLCLGLSSTPVGATSCEQITRALLRSVACVATAQRFSIAFNTFKAFRRRKPPATSMRWRRIRLEISDFTTRDWWPYDYRLVTSRLEIGDFLALVGGRDA